MAAFSVFIGYFSHKRSSCIKKLFFCKLLTTKEETRFLFLILVDFKIVKNIDNLEVLLLFYLFFAESSNKTWKGLEQESVIRCQTPSKVILHPSKSIPNSHSVMIFERQAPLRWEFFESQIHIWGDFMSHKMFLLQHDKIGIYDPPKSVLDKCYKYKFLPIFKI